MNGFFISGEMREVLEFILILIITILLYKIYKCVCKREQPQPMRMERGPGHGDDGEDPP